MKIAIDKVHEDGSGAPGVVELDGWVYAVDYLGGVKLTLLSQSSHSPSTEVAAQVEAGYLWDLHCRVTGEWFGLNRAMYGEAA